MHKGVDGEDRESKALPKHKGERTGTGIRTNSPKPFLFAETLSWRTLTIRGLKCLVCLCGQIWLSDGSLAAMAYRDQPCLAASDRGS